MEKLLIRGAFALLLVVFLGACPQGDPDPKDEPNEPGKPSGRVGAPVIGKEPSRTFNNEGIKISFTSPTTGADFYYTLDGSAPSPETGIKYNGPFSLEPGNANIRDTPLRGSIQVRVIGTKEGLNDSFVSSQNFQIFPKELIKDGGDTVIASASATGTAEGGYHSPSQKILVTVTVKDGLISAEYQNGYDGTTSHTPEYWTAATTRADQFLSTMNSWEFDTITGATRSSLAIKAGIEKAMSQIIPKD
ncbi:MAG: chitobiase/beta-hexosaminidase C-terminal domain-containing protein [Spirochaetaceae bacterium]|jgi:uncharacterized protein with FMN-binding domain|nr:chitobiase/beta-hexosaminidase C-terminal domain-containing protein [Spirochaetaceae bacterium]